MRIDEQIKILCIKSDLTISEIGRRLNKTPQAFSQKIKRGNFTIDDLSEIAMVTGCKLECSFVLPNGEKIKIE
ncbi:MAG: XRE family transcriptional regulator [Clostridiaceae bacterium]|jgi:predicted DNA-binding protein YlxM (UPF0122 family)|nr:XRE family transcriptional regulator [Clostridiaceae bacterium]